MKTIFSTIFLCFFMHISAQTIYDKNDLAKFNAYVEAIKKVNTSNYSTSEIAHFVSKLMLGTPYKGGTLDIYDDEKLIINLKNFDCVTYVENVIALTLCVKSNDFRFDTFTGNIQKIRYKDGIMNQYPSRLHYFSDWAANNQSKGILDEITSQIGGVLFEKNIKFMSFNAIKYKQLQSNAAYKDSIIEMEKQINNRIKYYIPKEQANFTTEMVHSGDIIGITTSIEGLDVVHLGLAYWQNNVLHFIHASSVLKKVVISSEPLRDYLQKIKNNTGIRVLRLK